jgi:hypothetical protein
VSFGAIDQDITSEANVGTAVDDLVATPNFYSDPNGTPPAGIAVTGQAATNGRWEYSTDGGPWTPFAAVSDASATLLWADGGGRSRIRFQPNATSGSTGSLTFRAWDGSDGRLNGATGVNIASTGGTAAYSSQHPTAAITVRPVEDSTPPTASLNAPNVTTAGTTYVFTVKYTDDRAVNVSTLDSADVRVAGLNNTFSQLATFDHVDPTGNGAERTATYRITPPGGSWSAANNGTYTVSLQAGQVADTAGNAAAASTLGTFVVDTVAPSVPSSSAASVRIAGRTSYTFTVTYADNIAVKGSTIGNGDVRVTGPKRFSQSATLVAVDAGGDGKRRTATYRITPPGGKWDAGDNGTYSVWMVPNQVSDTLGTFVAGRKLRTFSVNAAPDRVAPKAALSAPSLTTPTTANYFFTVTYTDNVELNWRTLDSRDVLVTGPKGFKTLATLDHVDVQANGPRRTATYRIAPPGGSWDAADSGTYTVTMQPNQVKDTSGRAVPSGRLGTFAVRVPAASPTAFSAGAALATSLDQRALLAAAADAAFASASEPQSRDRWSR